MQDGGKLTDVALDGLEWEDWLARAEDILGDSGHVQPLGTRHAALFADRGTTLLVSFESHRQIEDMSQKSQPLGWQLAQALDWSHLCMACNGETWFRDRRVYGHMDRLIDDGFFEDFERVIFYGAGSCGYAAAAFSVAAPGAQVLAIQPQATLDPRIAEWDDRFLAMRRTDFDDRYGYAPDMLDAAAQAFVLYDPEIEPDAMHAALFTRPNVTKFRMRHLGPRLETALMRMNILFRMLAQLSAGKLDRLSLARLYRARHRDGGYQFSLLKATTRDDRHHLTTLLARSVLQQREAPPFRKALTRASNALASRRQADRPDML